jgi:DNA-binding NarL/FixJ family response regulator
MVQKTITVALVEDDPGTRSRLARAVSRNQGLSLAFAAATVSDILFWLHDHQPDVLLVDLGLPDGSGIDVILRCRELAPQAEVMVITMFGDEANIIRAVEAGARGYLLKDGTEDDLANHVLSLHAGGSPMSPVIARQLLVRMGAAVSAPPAYPVAGAVTKVEENSAARLTAREAEILTTLARGYTYVEMARLLAVSVSTIQTHVKNIYSKLAVHSKTEAVFEARQMGLLDR